MKYFTFFFCHTMSLKPSVYFPLTAHLDLNWPLQVHSTHRWLMATVLDSVILDTPLCYSNNLPWATRMLLQKI